jgi:hypothetical protein
MIEVNRPKMILAVLLNAWLNNALAESFNQFLILSNNSHFSSCGKNSMFLLMNNVASAKTLRILTLKSIKSSESWMILFEKRKMAAPTIRNEHRMDKIADTISFAPQNSNFRATGKSINAIKKANAIGISTAFAKIKIAYNCGYDVKYFSK